MANKKTIQFRKHTLRAALETDNQITILSEVLEACLNYDDTGEIPNFETDEARTLFNLFRPELDEARERYEEISRERAEAGRKGGLVSGERRKQMKQK